MTAPRPRPYIVESDRFFTLHFEESQIQSMMSREGPSALVVPYTRAMAGFALFVPRPARISMIGLGGGSLVKHCLRTCLLPTPSAKMTVVELLPEVVALRGRFGLPADGAQLSVVVAEGSTWIADLPQQADVLLVDGFDHAGQAPELTTPAFYAGARAHLRQGGVMVVNLNLDDEAHRRHIRRIRDVFQGELTVVTSEDESNKVVFATRGPLPSTELLTLRAVGLEPEHAVGLPALAEKIAENLRRRPAARRRAAARI